MPLPYQCDLQHPILWNLGDIHFSDALYFGFAQCRWKTSNFVESQRLQVFRQSSICYIDLHLFCKLIQSKYPQFFLYIDSIQSCWIYSFFKLACFRDSPSVRHSSFYSFRELTNWVYTSNLVKSELYTESPFVTLPFLGLEISVCIKLVPPKLSGTIQIANLC